MQSPRGAQKPHQTPEQIPTSLTVFASEKKHLYNTPKGTQKTEAWPAAQAPLQTLHILHGRRQDATGMEYPPEHASEVDLDLPQALTKVNSWVPVRFLNSRSRRSGKSDV